MFILLGHVFTYNRNMNLNQLKPKSNGPLFPDRMIALILFSAAVLLLSIVLIPVVLMNSGSANEVATVLERPSERPLQTPEPYNPITPTPISISLTPTPNPKVEASISEYVLLQENDDYPIVARLQSRLIELGYLDSDEPSTVYSSATSTAVSLFQRTLDYEMTGVADSHLQEQLFSAVAASYAVKLGDDGPDVKIVQERLSELEYYTGKQSGYFGIATEEALRAFEAKNGLPQDGIYGVEDRDLLLSPNARPKIDPTPTPSPTPKPKKKKSSSSSSSNSSSPRQTMPPDANYTIGEYTASHSASGLVSVAKAMLGVPYVWSAENPKKGFDCSGLVFFCLRTCGVSTSRYSAAGFSTVSRWKNITSMSDLRAGDLVFFKSDSSNAVSHTGICTSSSGFVHASSSSGKVRTSRLDDPYWVRNFVNGRRVF